MDDVVNLVPAVDQHVATEPWLKAAASVADQLVAVLADRVEVVAVQTAGRDAGAVAGVRQQIPQAPGRVIGPGCSAEAAIPNAAVGDATDVGGCVNRGIAGQLHLDATHQILAGWDALELATVKAQKG